MFFFRIIILFWLRAPPRLCCSFCFCFGLGLSFAFGLGFWPALGLGFGLGLWSQWLSIWAKQISGIWLCSISKFLLSLTAFLLKLAIKFIIFDFSPRAHLLLIRTPSIFGWLLLPTKHQYLVEPLPQQKLPAVNGWIATPHDTIKVVAPCCMLNFRSQCQRHHRLQYLHQEPLHPTGPDNKWLLSRQNLRDYFRKQLRYLVEESSEIQNEYKIIKIYIYYWNSRFRTLFSYRVAGLDSKFWGGYFI